MKTAEQIFNDMLTPLTADQFKAKGIVVPVTLEEIKGMINAARKEAIEECAKHARITSESIGIRNGNELFLLEVDEQSILKLIDQLK